MDANPNGHADKPLSLKEIREQKRLIRAKLELHQLKNAERVLEASANWDYWLSSYVDLLDRYRDGGRLAYPISQPTDRRYGQNWPFWNTETQLSLLRAQARLLCTMNGYTIGFLSGLQAYVIGDGFQYRIVDRKNQNDTKKSAKPSSFALKVQEIIDEFCDVNDWSEWERELFWRSREDGEFFLRFYPDNDNRCMTVRCVEPEQVSMTGVPEATQEHWSFGIHTDPEDVQTVYGYNVLYMADPSNHANQIREEVPIEEILHFKINVKRTVKRGLSDFAFSTHDAFTVAEKLRNNMAEGAAVQSALAYIRQHESATQAQIQNFLNTQQIDFTRANPLTGQQINYKQFEPGTIADIPRGMQYVQPPGAGNASGFVDILHATLRGAGCRWNAPEWLATGSGADMAAYTASLTAHAPFVRSATQKQNAYKKVFTQVLWEAIEYAIDYGRLPLDTPHLIDIQCEAPSILARDERDEAQANQIRVTGGWKSRQTVQQEEGLDPEQEMQNIEAYNERFGNADKPGIGGKLVPVQEHHFNPSQLRNRFGQWTKAFAGGQPSQGDDDDEESPPPPRPPSNPTGAPLGYPTRGTIPVMMPDGSVRQVKPENLPPEVQGFYLKGRMHDTGPNTVRPAGLSNYGPPPPHPDLSTDENLDTLQFVLDLLGFIPVIGSVADLANAAISGYRGDYVGAGLSLAGAAPLLGNFAKVGGKLARLARISKAARSVGGLGKAALQVESSAARLSSKLEALDKAWKTAKSFKTPLAAAREMATVEAAVAEASQLAKDTEHLVAELEKDVKTAEGRHAVELTKAYLKETKGALEEARGALANPALRSPARTFWTGSTEFRGNKIYQRNDLIDPQRIDRKGRTNLARMQKGLAPIGPDGKSINIHHMLQTQGGALAEMPTTFHQDYSRIIHINPNTIPSGIDRAAFDAWRKEYWTNRAKDFAKTP